MTNQLALFDSTAQISFGKYKGKPFEVLLTDQEYALWLRQSMHDKLMWQYPELFAFITSRFGISDQTPDHNRLQTRFLVHDFCLKCALLCHAELRSYLANIQEFHWRKGWMDYVSTELMADVKMSEERLRWNWKPLSERLQQKQTWLLELSQFLAVSNQLVEGYWLKPVYIENLQFEEQGADVRFTVQWGMKLYPHSFNSIDHDNYPRAVWSSNSWARFELELKPIMGDDYPAVLRAMKVAKTTTLVVGEYAGFGATWDQVVETFKLSGIKAILVAELEGQIIPPECYQVAVPSFTTEDAKNIVLEIYAEVCRVAPPDTEPPSRDSLYNPRPKRPSGLPD